MQLERIFNPDVPWYNGQGCIVCGSNNSPEGEEFGYQCVDLGVTDEFLGLLGLCFNHAREVGNLVNMVPRDELEAIEREMVEREASVNALREFAESMMDAAAADREVIERYMTPNHQNTLTVAPTPLTEVSEAVFEKVEPATLNNPPQDPPTTKRTRAAATTKTKAKS